MSPLLTPIHLLFSGVKWIDEDEEEDETMLQQRDIVDAVDMVSATKVLLHIHWKVFVSPY